jgi:nucleoside-diphosphate-sugar epimerase
MRVLVTGGTGFLGSHIVRRLAEDGHEVTFMGRRADAGQTLSGEAGARFLQGDLLSSEDCVRATAGQEVVVHAAGLAAPWGSTAAHFRTNVMATARLLAHCRKAEVRRVVHLSTAALYLGAGEQGPVAERDPLPKRPLSPYLASMRLAEERVQYFAASTQREVITLRPANVFGAGDRTILPWLLQAHRAGRFLLVGGGAHRLDFTCVENVAAACALACTAPREATGRPFLLSNEEPVELASFLHSLWGRLGLPLRTRTLDPWGARALASASWLRARLLPGKGRPHLTRHTLALMHAPLIVDTSAAREVLGYTPGLSLAEGQDRLAAWIRAEHPSLLG